MAIRLSDVLELAVLRRAEVRAAPQALDRREIEGVSVIELPVEDFVRERELVLSTAMGCGHDEDLLLGFVAAIEASRASALALALGPYLPEVPPRVLEHCEARGFPLITLPWELRFADVIRGVADLHLRPYEAAERLQRELSQLLLQRVSLDAFCERVSRLLGAPVAVAGPLGSLRAASRGFLANGLPLGTARLMPATDADGWLELAEGSGLCHPIALSGRQYGAVLVGRPAAGAWDSEGRQALRQVPLAVTLWFLQEQVALETELRLREDFVWGLTRAASGPWEEVVANAALLGFDLTRPHVCLLGQLEPQAGEGALAGQARAAAVHQQLGELARLSARQVLVGGRSDQFVVFLEVPSSSKLVWQQSVDSFLDSEAARRAAILPGSLLSWGISRHHGEGPVFARAYQDALVALQVGRIRKGPGQRVDYQETGIYRALLRLAEDSELGEIVSSTVSPLLEYGRRKGVDLVATLSVYLRNQGNISQTAREMGLHRQSLIYRLEKIESLTGHPLLDPDARFLLHLCVELWQLGRGLTALSSLDRRA